MATIDVIRERPPVDFRSSGGGGGEGNGPHDQTPIKPTHPSEVGTGLAALTATLGLLSAYFQWQWAQELETTEAGFNTTLASTQSRLTIEVEKVKGQLDRTLEFANGRYAAERKAYDELLAVAYSYYYTLAALESHRWNGEQVAKADDAMVSSCRYLAAVDVADRTTWVSFWQAARAVEEEASKLRGLRQEDPGSEIGKQRHKV